MATLLSSEMSPQFAKWLNFPLHPVWPIGLDSLVSTPSERNSWWDLFPDAMRQRGGPIYTTSDLFCFVLPTLICELGKFGRLCSWHLISRFKWPAVISSVTCSNQTENNLSCITFTNSTRNTELYIYIYIYIYSYCFTLSFPCKCVTNKRMTYTTVCESLVNPARIPYLYCWTKYLFVWNLIPKFFSSSFCNGKVKKK